MTSQTTKLAAALLLGTGAMASTAMAQDCFLGEIKMFGGNFPPRGYAQLDGQTLQISQHTALFSILGTTYGGDGRSTFRLPDMRGRAPVHAGSGPGLSDRRLGQSGGTEENTLTTANLPSHSHTATTTATLRATSASGRDNAPEGNVLADDGADRIYSDATADVAMGSTAIEATTVVSAAGGGLPVNNIQPFQAINYIICLSGIFPSRS